MSGGRTSSVWIFLVDSMSSRRRARPFSPGGFESRTSSIPAVSCGMWHNDAWVSYTIENEPGPWLDRTNIGRPGKQFAAPEEEKSVYNSGAPFTEDGGLTMEQLPLLASLGVLTAGIYLLILGGAAALRPAATKRFLSSFASSARAHVAELLVRLILGAAFIVAAPRMMFSAVFDAFGWLLVATTLVLVWIPWRWHQRFAAWSVPMATRSMPLFSVGPLVGGVVILYALLGPL
jgi:hypothetical protein